MAKQFTCRACGAASGSDIFCSQACRAKYETETTRIEHDLTALGFVQHVEAHNVFEKDGVFLTVEEVRRNGIDAAIADHAAIASLPAKP